MNVTNMQVRVERVHVDGVQRTKADIIKQHVKKVFSASNFDEVGPHCSLSSEEDYRISMLPGKSWIIFLENPGTWKVVENHFTPGKSWKISRIFS